MRYGILPSTYSRRNFYSGMLTRLGEEKPNFSGTILADFVENSAVCPPFSPPIKWKIEIRQMPSFFVLLSKQFYKDGVGHQHGPSKAF